jgi:phage-related minor tail protein
MANTNLSLIPQNFPVTVNMLVVLKGAEKMETEMKGLRGKVAAFKKSMEDSGLEPLDVAGFIAEGGLLKPFQDGIKKAIEAQDALAKKARALKGLKVPKVVQGETSANLDKFNKALDNISLKIGQALLPAVNGIVTALTPVMTSIGQFVANNPYLVEGLAAAAVAFTAVTVGAMGLVAVLGILTSPIGLIAAAIAAAVALIVIGARLITDNWASISGFFSETWQSVSDATHRGIDKVQKGWDEMATGARLKFDSMQASAKQKWEEMKADAVAGASRLAEGASARLDAFGTKMGELWDSTGAVIKDYWNEAVADSVAGLQALKENLYTSPKAKLAEVWGSAQTVFSEFWESAAAKAATGMDVLKANLYTSPKARLAEVWGSAQTVFNEFWDSAAAKAATGWTY